jgi:hypothetical protein
VKENMNVIQNHISNCGEITLTLLNILSKKLNLTDPDLPSLHEFMRAAGNQMRLIKSNPGTNPLIVAGADIDFGSLTILFNNLGRLQVLHSPEQGRLWTCW